MAVVAGEFFFGERVGVRRFRRRRAMAGTILMTVSSFTACLFVLEVADIVVTDKDIDVGADIAAFVEQVFFQIGKIAGQFLDGAVDRAGANLQAGGIVGEFA